AISSPAANYLLGRALSRAGRAALRGRGGRHRNLTAPQRARLHWHSVLDLPLFTPARPAARTASCTRRTWPWRRSSGRLRLCRPHARLANWHAAQDLGICDDLGLLSPPVC